VQPRRSTASVVASPVLVGAVTVLIVIVGVYLAYNANKGLPFVPTYDLNAELPNGAKLVVGNDVRLGGFRVGVIDDVRPAIRTFNGRSRAIALVKMKIDRNVEPLSRDSVAVVRMRSALGLKYIQLIPGHGKAMLRQGDTIPVSSRPPVEYEDVFSTFDERTRDNSRLALKGFGDAFAARGASINEAIAALNPFFLHLTPVMKTLAAPKTRLRDFFKNIGQAAAEAAPVARVQAELFGKMAKTFDAFSACASCLQQTIEKAPPTLQSGISSFRVQEPFLASFTTLSRKLRPVATTLHDHLGTINAALETGIPVLKRTPILNRGTEDVFRSLDYLANQPQTLLALKDLHTTFLVGRPFLEYVAPWQTVCNDAVGFLTGLAGDHSIGVTNGTAQNALVKTGSNFQAASFSSVANGRPADVPANVDPQTYMDQSGAHYATWHFPMYGTAVDAQGNADCQATQTGYVNGPLVPRGGGKYPPANINPGESYADWEKRAAGGSHTDYVDDIPGLIGGTYVARRLHINNLRDVP
jgi:virulence factor Mce-like protein